LVYGVLFFRCPVSFLGYLKPPVRKANETCTAETLSPSRGVTKFDFARKAIPSRAEFLNKPVWIIAIEKPDGCVLKRPVRLGIDHDESEFDVPGPIPPHFWRCLPQQEREAKGQANSSRNDEKRGQADPRETPVRRKESLLDQMFPHGTLRKEARIALMLCGIET
jgi:hypothetical protein